MKPKLFLPQLAAILVLASSLAACGQRGPLYMPGSKPAKTRPAAAAQPATSVSPKSSEPAKLDASAPTKPDTSTSDKP